MQAVLVTTINSCNVSIFFWIAALRALLNKPSGLSMTPFVELLLGAAKSRMAGTACVLVVYLRDELVKLNHVHQPHQSFHPEPLVGGRVEPFVHGIEVSSGPLETQPLVQSSIVQPFIHGEDIIEAVPLVSEVHHQVTDPKVN